MATAATRDRPANYPLVRMTNNATHHVFTPRPMVTARWVSPPETRRCRLQLRRAGRGRDGRQHGRGGGERSRLAAEEHHRELSRACTRAGAWSIDRRRRADSGNPHRSRGAFRVLRQGPVHRIIAAVKRARPLAVSAVVGLVAVVGGCHRSPEARVLREFAGAYPVVARPNGAVREFEITAAEAELPLFEQATGSAGQPELPPGDGVKLRVWAYNGQVPGPTMRIRLGDTLRVRFTNRLPQPTTIHWHGVRVPNGMDGVPHLTQPPVAPGGHRSSTSSRPRTPARSGSTPTCARASRSSAASTAC